MASSPFVVTNHLVDAQYIREYPHATSTQEAPLKLAVKKYTPIDNQNPLPGDVTLIGVPGTGIPKELFEPLWEEILARSRQDGFRIRAIWIADVANQGASGIHNEKYLGNDPSWHDHSRDLLHMINHFRDDMPRPIMGLGHSLGAVQQIFLSLIHPRIFTSLILIEPYVHDMTNGEGGSFIVGAAKRKDVFPSRSVAEKVSRKMMKAWDPRVLDRWVEHGFRETPTALHPASKTSSGGEREVTFSTAKAQEAWMYIRKNDRRHKQLGLPDTEDDNTADFPSPPHDPLIVPDMIGGLYPKQRFYRPEPLLAWKLLPHIRPSVLIISGARSELTLTGHQSRAVKLTGTGIGGSGGQALGRVKHAVVQKSGHTVPLEKVSDTAGAIGPWLGEQLQKWKEDERRLADGWSDLSVKDRSSLSDEWWSNVNHHVSTEIYQREKKKASKL